MIRVKQRRDAAAKPLRVGVDDATPMVVESIDTAPAVIEPHGA